ncbi:helix-turn-helix transcriptional regulator [Arthrobacter mobilis]|uniref:HTH luxR-type domain-containing protein n=1 Tax=Arthrobacter mobilis TaxID=2724944 RepID=A0A7X6HA67_9MICC|nr:LuxR family transcriptional regulator [Arthrobacter mobilis]NKX53323.1 hypothetical protein [Arthrobacter mobilis]
MTGGYGTDLLVGRRDVMAEVQAGILGPGGGALVMAGPGLGKSALARAVVAGLEGRVQPLWIYADPALSGIPFGALAPHLGTLAAGEAGSVLAAMRSLMAGLRSACPEGKPVLMVVDDIHDLDDSSAVLVAQLVSSGTAKLLALGRNRPQIPQELLSLASDQLLTRHTLRPLTQPETDELCRAVLGGPVLAGSSASLRAAAGGVPGFLLALLAQARRSGALLQRNGAWVLAAEPGPPQARLVDLVRAQLGHRSEAAREALETIALAEPVPLQVLLRCAAGACVDELADGGTVTVGEDSHRLVRIGHPLHAQVIRETVPAGRSLRLRREVAAAMGGCTLPRAGMLRLLEWSLDCGFDVSEGQLLRAARLANDSFDSRLALKAAEAVTSARLRTAAQVEIGRAHANNGDYGQAAACLDGLLADAADLPTAAAAALLGVRVWLHGPGTVPPEDLQDLACRWAEAVERLAAPEAGGRHGRLAEWSRRGIDLIRFAAQVAEGDYSRAEAGLEGIIGQPDGFAECALLARVLAGEVLIATGRAESAAQLTSQAVQMLQQAGGRLLPFCAPVLSLHALALVRRGSLDELSRLLPAFLQSAAGQARAAGVFSLAAAAGQTGSAGLHLLKPAVEDLAAGSCRRLLPLVLAAGAYAAALAGDDAAADGYLARFSASGTGATAQLQLLGRGLAAAAGFLRGGSEAMLAGLREAAGTASRRGWTGTETELLTAAVRTGDLAALDQLMKVTDGAEGTWAAALNTMARAMKDADPEALAGLREREYGAEVLAVAVDGLKRAAAGGASRPAALSAALLPALERPGLRPGSGHREPVEAAGAAVPRSGTAAVRLTGRERDIAVLVAQGLKNAQIARQLCLSVRTVEGHIYRAFAKLGISRRDELTPDLLGSG